MYCTYFQQYDQNDKLSVLIESLNKLHVIMGKYNSLDNAKKVEIIKFVESGQIKCKKDVAAHFGIPASTLSTILQDKDKVFRKKLEGVKKEIKLQSFARWMSAF